MRVIRKSVGMVLILGAVLGCADEPETTPAVTPPSPPPRVASPPPTTQSEPAQGGMSAEMVKPSSKGEAKPGGAPKADESKKDEPPKVEGPKESSKSGAAAVKLTEDELAAIKELPAAEQSQAIAQAVCPVSDEHLGSMGKPQKVTAKGRSFYLCCPDCQKKVKSDPDSVIAKLDKK